MRDGAAGGPRGIPRANACPIPWLFQSLETLLPKPSSPASPLGRGCAEGPACGWARVKPSCVGSGGIPRPGAACARTLYEGITTTEVAAFLAQAHRAAGFDGPGFGIALFGEATAYPHGVPHPQTLREGDMVLIDCGAPMHGYVSDITRSYVFGAPTARQREIWELEHAAQAAAFEAVRPGAPCGAVDDAARGVIEAAGLGPGYAVPGLPHRTGHGVGMDVHEEPYLVRGSALPLEPGMTGSIEPTICLYGEFGVRLEDHFHVTPDGAAWHTDPSPSVDDPFGARD